MANKRLKKGFQKQRCQQQLPPQRNETGGQVAIAETTTADSRLAEVSNSLAESRIGFLDALEMQQEKATEAIADRVADLINPENFDRKLAAKIVEKTEGFKFDSPFTVPVMTLPPRLNDRMVLSASLSTNTLPAAEQTIEVPAINAG